jgi:hypothetical protein
MGYKVVLLGAELMPKDKLGKDFEDFIVMNNMTFLQI